uniref:Uncharacterized protein n=1 Tax=Cacopsylla melanoneura TaxID=428564 RepID=A0A8D9ABG4_9HEMI
MSWEMNEEQWNTLLECFHQDHYHVVHDCSNQSNQCRCCALIGKITSRFGRRLIPRYQFTIDYACNTVWTKEVDKSITYKSLGNSGHDMLIKLDCYDYSKCQGLSKKNYWKTATYSKLKIIISEKNHEL